MRLLLRLFLLSALSLSAAHAAVVEVTFLNGSLLQIQAVEYQGNVAMLTLKGGGVLGVATSRIRSVRTLEETALEPAAPRAEPEPLPMPEPALPAEPPVKASAKDDPPAVPESLSDRRASIEKLIDEAARRHGVEAALLRSLIAVESAFDPTAVSPKGAMGLGQLMPATAKDLGVTDPFDPAQAVDAAARHLKILLDRSGGAFVEALAAYNAGQGTVRRYGGLPPYGETIDYVEKVLIRYARGAGGAGGE